MAKLLGARVAWSAADNALQIHGGNGFALVKAATRFSSSARTAIADIATAAGNAASKPAASSGGAPIDATNNAPKGSSIRICSRSICANAIRGGC